MKFNMLSFFYEPSLFSNAGLRWAYFLERVFKKSFKKSIKNDEYLTKEWTNRASVGPLASHGHDCEGYSRRYTEPSPQDKPSLTSLNPSSLYASQEKEDKGALYLASVQSYQLLKQVKQSGFNIYALLYKLKIKKKWSKSFRIPPEIITIVCKAYLKNKDTISNPWTWFMKVLDKESVKWFVAQEQKKHSEVMCKRVKDLIAKILEEK